MDESFRDPSPWILSCAERHPAIYRCGVLLFGMAGYVYLAGVVALVVVVTGALTLGLVQAGIGPLWVRLSLPVLLLCLLAASALRSPLYPDDGLVLTRREAPVLHAVVESLRSRLAAAPPCSILIGTGLEIRVVRMPRLGSLLGFHNHLVLGLPLLVALPLPLFRALLAHELAHFSRERGVHGARLYRLRDRWLQLAAALGPGRHPGVVLMRGFYRWYAPRFAALSLPFARKHELAADRRAVLATGRDAYVNALVRAGVVERFLNERFYPRLLADYRRYGVSPSGLRSRLDRALKGIRDDRRSAAWLEAALSREDPTDSHPAASSRLAALGVSEHDRPEGGFEAAFAEALDGDSAARHMLGTASREIELSIEHAWIEDVMRSWAHRHDELQRWDERRRQLDERDDLSPVETLEQAIATAEIDGTDAALPMLRGLIARRPDMAPARFVLGTLLLRRNEEEGLEQVEDAMELDAELVADGCELVASFLRSNGRHEEAADCFVRFGLAPVPEPEPRAVNDGTGTSEPARVEPADSLPESSTDGYHVHGLDGPELLTAKRGIAPVAAVARAFLVREVGPHRKALAGAVSLPVANTTSDAAGPGPRFLLAIELMRGDHDPHTVARRLAHSVKLPGPTVIAVLTRRHRKLRRTLSNVTNALLFQRTRRRAA